MVLDRLTLNIAYMALRKIEATEGHISDILFSKREHFGNEDRTVSPKRLSGLKELRLYIDEVSPLYISTLKHIDCFPLGLYELKSFQIEHRVLKGTSMLVQNGTNKFKTKDLVSPVHIEELNKGYLPIIDVVTEAFESLKFNPYIIDQSNYVDCGYIEIYFEEALLKLDTIYKKYRVN